MAATTGTAAYGTLLQRSTDGVTYTTIAEVTSISGPGQSMETLDFTHMESPSGYREIKPSFKNGGEVTFELNYLPDDSAQNVLYDDFDNRTLQYFKIVWTDTGTSETTFRGYVTTPPSPSAPVDGKLSASATITISGPVTHTPASG